MKSEPDVFSWDRLLRDKRAPWDGVRNYQANNNMKAMKIGDEAFFYHSNEGREIVGVMKIIRLWYLDPSDETDRFGMVDVAPVKSLKSPVTLASIKIDPRLEAMALLRQGRLSVSPVTAKEWQIILRLGGLVG
jgi:predicted RNA-binding protein with PUA-like domain